MQHYSPYEITGGDPAKGLVLVADHAMNRLPPEYGRLGLPESAFERHIAYDIGIEPLTRQLSAALDAPAVLGCFSRLLIDPNRGEDDPTLIMKISDGAIVPGNHPISDEEWQNRIRRFHRPYHEAVSETIARSAPPAEERLSSSPCIPSRPSGRAWHAPGMPRFSGTTTLAPCFR